MVTIKKMSLAKVNQLNTDVPLDSHGHLHFMLNQGTKVANLFSIFFIPFLFAIRKFIKSTNFPI